jgi:outer membrane protein TolC
MKTRLLTLMFIAMVFPVLTLAETVSSERKTLSLDSFVKQLGEVLPELKSNTIDLLSAENDLRSSKGTGNVALTADGSMSSAKQYSDPGGTSGKIQENSLSVGASKKIVSTGTTVKTTVGYDRDSYSSFPSASDSTTYRPTATLKVTQPLLYNFLGKVDQYTEKDATMKVEVQKLRLSANNKSTLNAYKKLYFQWELYRRILKDNEDSISNAKRLNEQLAQNFRAGLAEDYSYHETTSSLLKYKSAYRDNQIILQTIEKQLGVYLDTADFSPDAKEFDAYLKQALENTFSTVDFTKTESSKIIDLSIKRYAYSENVYSNKLLPEFDVFGSVSRKNRDDAFGSSVSTLPDTDYSVGFSFSYKLGNDEAAANLQSMILKKKALEYEYSSTLNSYKKSLLGYQESAAGTKELTRNKQEIINALALQLAGQKRKYSQGRLSISDVITTENSISSARIELLNLKYALIAAYLDYSDLVK